MRNQSEDISAPRCFEIERKLKENISIPVFHDDQHGTAIVVLAAWLNALRIIKKKMEDLVVVINGLELQKDSKDNTKCGS